MKAINIYRSGFAGKACAACAPSWAMGMLVAARHNPVISQYYTRLCAMGKAKKVALVACMRKLITILNAILKHHVPWRFDQAVLVSNSP